MVAKLSELEPEKQTKEVAAAIFREVLGHRLGYERGLGEMVIPESSRKYTESRFTELIATTENYEKYVAYHKSQLVDNLRGNVS